MKTWLKILCTLCTCVPYSDSKKNKKTFKVYKPYWNEELQTAWDNMHNDEKVFKNGKVINIEKHNYIRNTSVHCKNLKKLLKYKER